MRVNVPLTIYLINKVHSQDSIGQDIVTETETSIEATIESVSSKHKEELRQLGIFSEWKALVWVFEYDQQDEVEVDNVRYKVAETYWRTDSKVELYLEKVVD